ncbi:ATP-binding protein, partial [Streptomyces brasiliscabiei]
KAISRLETHLGLYLHRYLQRGLKIDIAVWDVGNGGQGLGEEVDHIAVEALDPFGYKVPGKAGYPREFIAPVESLGELRLKAHIWPAKS